MFAKIVSSNPGRRPVALRLMGQKEAMPTGCLVVPAVLTDELLPDLLYDRTNRPPCPFHFAHPIGDYIGLLNKAVLSPTWGRNAGSISLNTPQDFPIRGRCAYWSCFSWPV